MFRLFFILGNLPQMQQTLEIHTLKGSKLNAATQQTQGCPTPKEPSPGFLCRLLSTARLFHPNKSLFRLPSCGMPDSPFQLCKLNKHRKALC